MVGSGKYWKVFPSLCCKCIVNGVCELWYEWTLTIIRLLVGLCGSVGQRAVTVESLTNAVAGVQVQLLLASSLTVMTQQPAPFHPTLMLAAVM